MQAKPFTGVEIIKCGMCNTGWVVVDLVRGVLLAGLAESMSVVGD